MSEIKNKIPQAVERLVQEVSVKWTNDSADEVYRQIIAQGEQPKTGQNYGGHTASAPGESWANQSGELGRSFGKEKTLQGLTLGSALARAKIETGIKSIDDTVKIDARPTIAKAVRAAAPTIENLLAECCERAAEV